MLAQNMTQVKPRSPAVMQRLKEHDLTRLNGLTVVAIYSKEENGAKKHGFYPMETTCRYQS